MSSLLQIYTPYLCHTDLKISSHTAVTYCRLELQPVVTKIPKCENSTPLEEAQRSGKQTGSQKRVVPLFKFAKKSPSVQYHTLLIQCKTLPFRTHADRKCPGQTVLIRCPLRDLLDTAHCVSVCYKPFLQCEVSPADQELLFTYRGLRARL